MEAGGGLAAIAVTLLVVNLSAPLAARGKGHTVTGLRFALAGFVATACFGVTYVADRRGNWFDLSGHTVLAHAIQDLIRSGQPADPARLADPAVPLDEVTATHDRRSS